ncbi:hypothetical protein KIL84_017235 [Mauremys mutica]|uniref:Uncharacterized protein n=1 Tax=Mauremys mutica TaxID=74926 RepID=A0A9D3X5R4_9SAUR|nr:hypothetical protein KIL84_017235 [Mauremys mutica]
MGGPISLHWLNGALLACYQLQGCFLVTAASRPKELEGFCRNDNTTPSYLLSFSGTHQETERGQHAFPQLTHFPFSLLMWTRSTTCSPWSLEDSATKAANDLPFDLGAGHLYKRAPKCTELGGWYHEMSRTNPTPFTQVKSPLTKECRI